MSNRNLSAEELLLANNLLKEVRVRLSDLSHGDVALLFAYRRKIAKELGYDERGKPMQRKILKLRKKVEQGGKCLLCSGILPKTHAVLDRYDAILGYTMENTRLICQPCDVDVQTSRGYR